MADQNTSVIQQKGTNVGIGTNSPSYKLDVYTSGATSAVRINSDSSFKCICLGTKNGIIQYGLILKAYFIPYSFYFLPQLYLIGYL